MDQKGEHRKATPEDIKVINKFTRTTRKTGRYDIIVEGKTPGKDPKEDYRIVAPYAESGATWWIESLWGAMDKPDGPERVRGRILAGPPKV